MNQHIEALKNAANEIKRLNSKIEHIRLMKACLEDHVKSVEYHNDELRAENQQLQSRVRQLEHYLHPPCTCSKCTGLPDYYELEEGDV